MKGILNGISGAFSGGCLGGLLNSLAVWGLGSAGITAAMNVQIAPALSPEWLYPRIAWGGLWGALFLLPFFTRKWVLRGLFWSLGPTLVQLFVVFPSKGRGMMGVDLGTLTPAFVLFFNAVWGLAASLWIKFLGEGK